MNLSSASGLLAALVFAASGTALANKAFNIQTGTVTSVEGNQIVVDGVAYNVASTKALKQALLGVQPGQQVQVILDNPPSPRDSKVISITAQPH